MEKNSKINETKRKIFCIEAKESYQNCQNRAVSNQLTAAGRGGHTRLRVRG